MSSLVDSNRLSLSNYLETLAIIAFLSFAIGLYWRFKFRSKYLAMELEETRLLNEELKKMQAPEQSSPNEMEKLSENPCPQELTLTGTTNESVTLQISHLLYIEAVGNYVKVCHLDNGQVRTDLLRATPSWSILVRSSGLSHIPAPPSCSSSTATNHFLSHAAICHKSRLRFSEGRAMLASTMPSFSSLEHSHGCAKD